MSYVKPRVFVADFETTVTGENKNQESTEVWASALVELYNDEVIVRNCIQSFFADLFALDSNCVVYFHNLKFDGSFIVDYLLNRGYSTAVDKFTGKWTDDRYMSKKSFKCTISDKGVWYTIKVKSPFGKFITFKDSLKLLPFSVAQIGKAFQTKHQKLTMEYVGNMKAGGTITPEQRKYIENDVLVVKEALEIMFDDGLDKLTIGACCKDQYKKSIMDCDFQQWFPNLSDLALTDDFGEPNADAYIRKSYKGGWCYLKKGCENQIFYNGITADVNSLYPSVMLDCMYPVGKPFFWKGDYIPDNATKTQMGYFIRVKTRFKLKPNHLPTIQIKGDWLYRSNEWLETSDAINPRTGDIIENVPILTLTMMDWELLKKHYYLFDTEILDGCYFWLLPGKLLFGDYINKWAEIKKNNKGAKRTQAKLFLNNLYGKFSSRIDNSTKLPFEGEDGKVHFSVIEDIDPKKAWYIPIGSYVTSHARNFTITAAQKNYEHFIYADTDSIHCNCSADDLKGIKVHPTNFSCWDLEVTWSEAIFVRQKTYIERVIEEELTPVEKPYYQIKCAGMDKRPKQLLAANLNHEEIELNNQQEIDFMKIHLDLTDFRVGLRVPGSLKPRRIPGGILLITDYYTMRETSLI